MSFSPKLATTFNETRLRTQQNASPLSGMCSTCSDQCTGLCEIGLSAVRGFEASYPCNTNTHQFASEKIYPFDYSHFNINGRVFGVQGFDGDPDTVTPFSANLSCSIGYQKKIRLKAPVILPAMAKLNWRDYYSGAAMAGVLVVIGESAIRRDPCTIYDNRGKVSYSPLIGEMIGCFRKFEKDDGDIVLQVNCDDVFLETAEYALRSFPLRTIEIKFGQAAKGIQHVAPVYDHAEALQIKKDGYLVIPDPSDQTVIEAVSRGETVRFMQAGRLPMWDEEKLSQMISRYRALGAENIFFKMAGYDIADIHRVLRIASDNHVALVTFDGAGGGSGHSPCKMMNEWSYPTIELERIVHSLLSEMDREGAWIPAIAMAGGVAFEDTAFKALALGAPYVKLVGIGRAAMAAAKSADAVGRMISCDTVPEQYKKFGNKTEDIFVEAKILRERYHNLEEEIPVGSIGLYSFIQRLSGGMQMLMTLNRKFSLELLDQSDVIPLTREAREYLDSLLP